MPLEKRRQASRPPSPRRSQAGRPVPIRAMRCNRPGDRSSGREHDLRAAAARRRPRAAPQLDDTGANAQSKSLVNQPYSRTGCQRRAPWPLQCGPRSVPTIDRCPRTPRPRRARGRSAESRSRARAQVEPHGRSRPGKPKRDYEHSIGFDPVARRAATSFSGEITFVGPEFAACRSSHRAVVCPRPVRPRPPPRLWPALEPDRAVMVRSTITNSSSSCCEEQWSPSSRSPANGSSSAGRLANEDERPLARALCARQTRMAASQPGATGARCSPRQRCRRRRLVVHRSLGRLWTAAAVGRRASRRRQSRILRETPRGRASGADSAAL